ncbi:MAG: PH domain-containing protein [Candidatus Hadarchaeum sp.]|uniref:PH domain-containing protein n=2 Tax=Candidatus Hadarchaeum sp. TaxID=2883567 RepID=UPI0031754C53
MKIEEGVNMEIGKKFYPHPNLKKVYFSYLALAAAVPLAVCLFVLYAAATYAPELWRGSWPYLMLPLAAVVIIIAFVIYWIQKYYASISYTLTSDEVLVERGVWWKMKHTVPYARVMSIDVIQGPLSRKFGIGSVQIYTAGYTGPVGGTSGPGSRGAEASIWGVTNFLEIRETILRHVRSRPLFGVSGKAPADVGTEILKELRSIRRALAR